ncbi:MAG TPA: two-component system response regulator CreB [Telluria sp.]
MIPPACRTILIVEDEPSIAESLAYALRTDGFTPVHVMLGRNALKVLHDRKVDVALAILDVGLPDMSGFELCRQLRQFSNVPVIFLTARNEEVDRIVGLEIGADDYVTKPFSPRELVARVRVVLRRLGPHPAPEIGASATRPGGFEIRAAEARILFRGRALDLTRYEYLLLKTLAENPHHVFSRAHLMDCVWTDAPDTLDRTVDAHIKSLRAKLRTVDRNCDPIRTHRGLGYSVDPE